MRKHASRSRANTCVFVATRIPPAWAVLAAHCSTRCCCMPPGRNVHKVRAVDLRWGACALPERPVDAFLPSGAGGRLHQEGWRHNDALWPADGPAPNNLFAQLFFATRSRDGAKGAGKCSSVQDVLETLGTLVVAIAQPVRPSTPRSRINLAVQRDKAANHAAANYALPNPPPHLRQPVGRGQPMR